MLTTVLDMFLRLAAESTVAERVHGTMHGTRRFAWAIRPKDQRR